MVLHALITIKNILTNVLEKQCSGLLNQHLSNCICFLPLETGLGFVLRMTTAF